MSKSIATKVENAVSTEVSSLADWGTPVSLGQDMVLAKILPMQGTSQLVTDGKAMFGEFRDSLTGAKLGSITEPIALVPFHVQKFWDIQEMNEEGKYKWVRTEPLVENPVDKNYNDNLPWSDKVDGVDIKRVRRMNFFVLVPSEIEKGTSIPMVLAFKSTSYKEGKKLLTQMYLRNLKEKLPPPGYTIVLSGIKQKNDDGQWVIPQFELGRKSTPAEMTECLNWFKLINKGGVKVDESDIDDATDVSSTPVGEDTGTGAY